MAKIESQSEKTASDLKDFFVPSLPAGALLFLAGTLLLLAYSTRPIINWAGSRYLQTANQLSLNINILNNGITKSFSSTLGGRLGQIVFWSLIGALAYVALWFLRNIFNSFENDIIIDHYMHPSSFNRAGYWGSTIAGKIFFAVLAVLAVAFGYLSVKVIMPGVAALTSSSVYNFHLPDSLGYLVLSVLISTLVVYILIQLLRTLGRLWKLL